MPDFIIVEGLVVRSFMWIVVSVEWLRSGRLLWGGGLWRRRGCRRNRKMCLLEWMCQGMQRALQGGEGGCVGAGGEGGRKGPRVLEEGGGRESETREA